MYNILYGIFFFYLIWITFSPTLTHNSCFREILSRCFLLNTSTITKTTTIPLMLFWEFFFFFSLSVWSLMLPSDKKIDKLDYPQEHVQRKKSSNVFHWSFLACILNTNNNNNSKKKPTSANGRRIVCVYVCICSPKNTETIFFFSFSLLFFSFSLGCSSNIQWWLGRRLIIYICLTAR
jgi:hypothetical protein